MAPKSVIVVGAGAGGIATATKLAKAGFQVTVVEKHDFVGGRCSLIHHDGYRFDQGPSLLLMPELFHEAFEDLGTTMSAEGVKLLKCEPNYHVWFPDNDCFELSTDFTKMKTQIEAHEGPAGFHRFLGFMQESGKHYQLSVKHVLRKNFASFTNIFRPDFFATVFDMHPFESIYARAARYFKSDKMRRVFTFASMYLGMNPYEAPATYSLLQFTEIAHGILYPVGGFQSVLQALADVGKRMGVEYLFNSPVSSVLLSKDQKTVEGVELENGKELRADIVVMNADLVYAYNNLLPPTNYARSLKTRSASCSSISFFWSFDSIVPELDVHNIFLADQYSESFDAIFKKHGLPDDPSFYVNVPSRVDKTAAPEGKDAVVVLVPIGHLLENKADESKDWPKIVENTRNLIIDTIERRTGARNLRKRITHEDVNTPSRWREKFNLDRGAILGLSHSFFNVLCFRPKTRHSDIKGLYFVGASTHPGTGVPVCLAGGKIVSEQIVNDCDRENKSRSALSSQIWGPLLLISFLLVVYNLTQGHVQRQFSLLTSTYKS